MIATSFDKVFDEIFSSPFSFNLGHTSVEQIKEDNGDYQLYIDALGHDPSDIDIQVTPTKLTITSENKNNFSRLVKPINLKYTLGNHIDSESIDAEFKNGILIISVPIRGDTKDNVRRLQIKN